MCVWTTASEPCVELDFSSVWRTPLRLVALEHEPAVFLGYGCNTFRRKKVFGVWRIMVYIIVNLKLCCKDISNKDVEYIQSNASIHFHMSFTPP